MLSLFPDSSVYPDGFIYEPGFLGREEEAQLVEYIRDIELHTFRFQGYEAKRRVASFGHDWNFETRTLSPGKPVPEFFSPLIHKVAQRIELEPAQFAELLVTAYPPGSVINWHRDAPPFALIAGISLQSDCQFRLRPYDKSLQSARTLKKLVIARRSLYVMQGTARTDWEHSTSPVKALRYSVTLRTLYENGPRRDPLKQKF